MGAWKGEGEGRMANAPPPETCQLIAMNFCERRAVSEGHGQTRVVITPLDLMRSVSQALPEG